ncbi:S-adenosyl-L-methionine-dependent methyltransferases superfamily protein [Raphanus sativus]|nr:S-adenosyl-L-methionine-dependent methyltransferases superfamily protein [Raphanus sativus]
MERKRVELQHLQLRRRSLLGRSLRARRAILRLKLRPYFRAFKFELFGAVMSEDMVKDGYEEIMNVDISSVAIEMIVGKDAPLSAWRMLGEVSRLIKPGGTYFLITYGGPKVRMPHLTPAYNWNISLYILPLFIPLQQDQGFKKPGSSSYSAAKSRLEAIPLTSEGMLPHDYVLEDPDSHFIYICNKKG